MIYDINDKKDDLDWKFNAIPVVVGGWWMTQAPLSWQGCLKKIFGKTKWRQTETIFYQLPFCFCCAHLKPQTQWDFGEKIRVKVALGIMTIQINGVTFAAIIRLAKQEPFNHQLISRWYILFGILSIFRTLSHHQQIFYRSIFQITKNFRQFFCKSLKY